MILTLFVLFNTLLSLMPEKENLKWKLSWHDEFNYTGLPDSAKWSYETGYIRNDELQYYTKARIKNSRVENGHLIVESYKEDYNEYKNYRDRRGRWPLCGCYPPIRNMAIG